MPSKAPCTAMTATNFTEALNIMQGMVFAEIIQKLASYREGHVLVFSAGGRLRHNHRVEALYVHEDQNGKANEAGVSSNYGSESLEKQTINDLIMILDLLESGDFVAEYQPQTEGAV